MGQRSEFDDGGGDCGSPKAANGSTRIDDRVGFGMQPR